MAKETIEQLKAQAFDLINKKQEINNELSETYQKIQELSN